METLKYKGFIGSIEVELDDNTLYGKVLGLENFNLSQCLFGEHLLSSNPTADVVIVESEKTALICAIHFGNFEHHLFVACGGLKNLRADAIQPLIDMGRDIYLWPDKDGIEDWNKLCDKFSYDRMKLYTSYLDHNWCEQDGDKADAADIIIRVMQSGGEILPSIFQ